jgi:hypothetical protein
MIKNVKEIIEVAALMHRAYAGDKDAVRKTRKEMKRFNRDDINLVLMAYRLMDDVGQLVTSDDPEYLRRCTELGEALRVSTGHD